MGLLQPEPKNLAPTWGKVGNMAIPVISSLCYPPPQGYGDIPNDTQHVFHYMDGPRFS